MEAALEALDYGQHRKLTDYLGQFLTAERRQRIEAVLTQRTRYLTVVLEDLHRPHNAGAVLRNCDSFGIQDVHIIENTTGFKTTPKVTRGCHQWLSLHRYSRQRGNTLTCLSRLRDAGYRLVATAPNASHSLHELSLDSPIALLFGNELEGLSTEALAQADLQVRLPMYGFSESFNVSVCTALGLQPLCHRLRSSDIAWQLSDPEKALLRAQWYRLSHRGWPQLEAQFWAAAGSDTDKDIDPP